MEETTSSYGSLGIHLRFRRFTGGVQMNVRALPEVEEFVKGLGDGATIPLSQYGGIWSAPGEAVEPLVYNLDQAMRSADFTLGGIGEALVDERRGHANLSFLRFKGISQEGGVTFVVKSPMSRTMIRGIGPVLSRAASRLVDEYISPVDIEIRVILSAK